MKKRILSLLLVMLMVVSLVPTAALADRSDTDIAYPVTNGNIYFDKSTGTITDCDESATIANIPSEISGTAVKNITYYAFEKCIELTSITIPNSVTWIGASAFRGCTSLTSIEIPDSVTSIGQSAFSGCTSLMSITISSNVTSIDDSTFKYCKRLTSITIPSSVTSIGKYVFSGCESLKEINVEADNSAYSSDDGVLLNKSQTMLKNCPGGKNGEYAIPETVTEIREDAFSGCSGLTSVTIPNSVTSIGSYAFSGCSGLTSVTIPNSVTSISSYAFSGCSGLTSVTIPNGVTSIGSHAFYSCTGLACVTIPNGVTSIGSYAFYSCTGLACVTIPNGVTSIGSYAFGNCEGLACVTIPNSVTSIGVCAFVSCQIGDVYYAGSEAEWNAIDFTYFNEALTGATIHYGEETHTHDYTAVVTAPTCTEKGYTTYSCTICGDSYKGSYTNALGHHYANGKCTRCGAADPDYKPVMNFVDVPSTSYCYDAVQWAVANGITNGTDATHFSPNAGCTRAQVVTFLWRAAGSPDVSAKVNFVDVSASSVYYKAIKWAVANGITKGTDATHFSPNATCTRGQVVTFMYRAAGEPAVSGSGSFVDVASGSYCYSAVQWAVANGITKGTDATHFSPNATCTRGQVVTFLYRAQ